SQTAITELTAHFFIFPSFRGPISAPAGPIVRAEQSVMGGGGGGGGGDGWGSSPPAPGGAPPYIPREDHWTHFDNSVNAVSFGFVATAILISIEVSVVMPGNKVPTFIAKQAPVPCPPERMHWPSHQLQEQTQCNLHESHVSS
ncbi:cell division protein FtsW homolog, partial [Striga asiatica]